MNTGDRIKQRRMELGLTVDDLAERINKSRATIYRYENGDIENMPTTILEPLAKALYTTPADLMGWEQVDSHFSGKEAPKEIYDKFKSNVSKFHEEHKELFDIYGKLSSPNQKRVLTYSKNLLMNQQMEEELAVQAAHERTDIEVTDEMRQHDDDIMDDENF
jgi:transcriptional regulator with XRE-family HTH domain|nr:MAG TPA: helix-turn-helix domain protein [Caudoviricetes sp.]